MSQTSIDHLFQLTAPGPERSIAASPRGGETRTGFGDHLSRAAVSTSQDSSQADHRDGLADRSRQESSIYGASSARSDTPAHDSSPSGGGDTGTAETSSAADCDRDSQDDDLRNDTAAQSSVASPDGSSDTEQSDDKQPDDENETASDENELADAASDTKTPSASSSNLETALVAITKTAGGDTIEQSAPNVRASDRQSSNVEPKVTNHGGQNSEDGIEQSLNEVAKSANANQHGTSPTRAQTNESLEKENNQSAHSTNKTGQKHTAQPQAIQEASKEGGAELTDKPLIEPNTLQDTSKSPVKSKRATENKKAATEDVRQGAPLRNNVDAGARPDAAPVAANVVAQAADVTVKVAIKSEASEPSSRVANSKGDSLVASFNRSQPGISTAKRGRANAGEEAAPHVDATRFVGRVAKAFQTAHERGGTLNLRLSPPELGSLRLELTVKDGVMNASLQAETDSARRVLLDHLPALRDRLAEQNIRIERFDVDVRREGGGSVDDRTAQQQHQNQQQHESSPRRPASQPRIAATPRQEDTIVQHKINDREINLVV